MRVASGGWIQTPVYSSYRFNVSALAVTTHLQKVPCALQVLHYFHYHPVSSASSTYT